MRLHYIQSNLKLTFVKSLVPTLSSLSRTVLISSKFTQTVVIYGSDLWPYPKMIVKLEAGKASTDLEIESWINSQTVVFAISSSLKPDNYSLRVSNNAGQNFSVNSLEFQLWEKPEYTGEADLTIGANAEREIAPSPLVDSERQIYPDTMAVYQMEKPLTKDIAWYSEPDTVRCRLSAWNLNSGSNNITVVLIHSAHEIDYIALYQPYSNFPSNNRGNYFRKQYFALTFL